MKFSTQDLFSKCDQIRSFLWIRSHLLKTLIYYAVSEPEKLPRLFWRFGRLSMKSLPIATSDSLSTKSLCECKIASAFKRFCVLLDRNQLLTRFAKEKDLLGVALVAPGLALSL